MKHLFTLVLLLLAACSTFKPVKDTSIRHVLEPLVPDRTLNAATPAIAINRPSLPSYLDRMQLITRTKGRLMMSNIDLWAEPLDAAIARVTASNLSRLTSSTNIQPVANFATLDYTTLLEINIAQFEPDDDNQMILQGTWKKQPVTGKQTSAHFFKIFIPIPVNDSPMSARVISMNQALEQLARQIVRQP
jgi:uncharacterized lipoprotein YmbA